jgi:hypothetical protein
MAKNNRTACLLSDGVQPQFNVSVDPCSKNDCANRPRRKRIVSMSVLILDELAQLFRDVMASEIPLDA